MCPAFFVVDEVDDDRSMFLSSWGMAQQAGIDRVGDVYCCDAVCEPVEFAENESFTREEERRTDAHNATGFHPKCSKSITVATLSGSHPKTLS